MKHAAKIGETLAAAYRARERGATEVSIALPDLAKAAKLPEPVVRDVLTNGMNAVWMRLPIGTSLTLAQPDLVTVFAR